MRVYTLTRKIVAAAVLAAFAFTTPGVMAAAPRKLVLQIHEVKCNDETTGKYREKFGVDTIALGGISIDPMSTVKRFNTWHVGEFKKDGVVRRFGNPHRLVEMPFAAKLPSQKFQVVLVLAELDPGKGLDKQLEKIAAAGSKAGMDKAKSLLGVGFDAAVKEAQSGQPKTIEAYAAQIGSEMLKVKAEEWFQDDLFPPLNVRVRVKGPDFRFDNGKTESARETLVFTGGRIQGKYTITYSWKVI
jgi:hypothetical protein